MLRFSLSGVILVFDIVQSSAAMTDPKDAAMVGVTLVVAVVTALPEITRWANAFVAGDLFAEPVSETPGNSDRSHA